MTNTAGAAWAPFAHPEEPEALWAWRSNVGEPAALELAPPLAQPPAELDVLSWNLAVGTGRLPEVLARVRSERPLVILAQEAFRADASVPAGLVTRFHGGRLRSGRSIIEIAEQEGLSLRYAPSMRNGVHASDRGNAVLATVALGLGHAFSLPYVRQRRVAVAAELAGVPGVVFASAHLDTRGAPPSVALPVWAFGSGRAAQAAALGSHLLRAGASATLLGADLNTPLGERDPALAALLRLGFAPARRSRVWRHTYHGALRLALDHLLFHDPVRRIRSIHVTRLDETPADRGRRVFGSDHHPLLARVALAGV